MELVTMVQETEQPVCKGDRAGLWWINSLTNELGDQRGGWSSTGPPEGLESGVSLSPWRDQGLSQGEGETERESERARERELAIICMNKKQKKHTHTDILSTDTTLLPLFQNVTWHLCLYDALTHAGTWHLLCHMTVPALERKGEAIKGGEEMRRGDKERRGDEERRGEGRRWGEEIKRGVEMMSVPA